jgi:hypothetical protein
MLPVPTRSPRSPAGIVALLACLPAACATYPQRTAGALRAFEHGDFAGAEASFADTDVTGSAFLSGAEAGMAAMAAGNWSAALEHLHRAVDEAREIEERALVSATDLGEGLLTWVVNESARTYQGEGFERVMLHASLALAYLATGSVDDVWVEARLANQVLEREEELYEKQYKAGGLGHCVSALMYEVIGEYDEAYIDYRRMHEKGVGTELAGRALVRLAARLGYTDDLERWSARYGPPDELPEGAASIVVVAGVGPGALKEEITLPIPTGDGLLQWSVPQFVARPQPISALRLETAGGETALRTSVIEDVTTVSRENLADRIAWLAAKSAVRAVLKRELTQQLEDQFDVMGWIAGNLFTLASERADLRSWTTLPDTWQAGRAFVLPGVHELSLTAVGGDTAFLGAFELEPGETMFVLARTAGGRVYAHAVGGRPVPAQEPAGQEP